MFMSRIHLNRRRRGAVEMLANRNKLHAAVESCFAPGAITESDEGRLLWRIDRDGDAVSLIVVSPEKPSMIHIAEQAGWADDQQWQTRDYAGFLDAITDGQRYAFRITANPTRRVNGKVKAHTGEAHQLNWLAGKSEENGFAIDPDSVRVSHGDSNRFRRADDAAGARVTLVTAQFDGTFTVTDANALRKALTKGIGRAKGYGCGLLTVAPLP